VLIDEFGFDVVDVGPLAEGWHYQRDTAAYAVGVHWDADELRAKLGEAKRYAEM
jgi:8-hydroxy-5-deazaflavin:NADPH oxidoreductase